MAEILCFPHGPHIGLAFSDGAFAVTVHGVDLLKKLADTLPAFPPALRLAVDLMILGGVPLIIQPMTVKEYASGRGS